MMNHPNRSRAGLPAFTVSYCQTRDGHCAPRAETIIRAANIGDAAEAFVSRQIKKGRGFINTWIAGADGKKLTITQAKSWADVAHLGPID